MVDAYLSRLVCGPLLELVKVLVLLRVLDGVEVVVTASSTSARTIVRLGQELCIIIIIIIK